MAPIGERADRENFLEDQNDEEEGHNLWASILGEVQSSSATKLPTSKSLLAIGDNESGKTTLIAKLQGAEDPKKGSGLEYMYINIKDEYRDDHTRLGVWILDGDLGHRGLLKFALTEETFAHSLVMLVVSMAQPWNILETLQRWAEVLNMHVDRLRLPRDQRHEYQESLVRQFQEYVEPSDDSEKGFSSQARRGPNPLHPTASKGDEEKVLLPLGENTLTNNLGIPIIVVVTKTDAISALEKEHDYREEHFDFMQQHIRKFCLNYGAALFYTSVKEEKNCDLLHRYLAHRIYGFPFSQSAYVVEKDSVFIPSGWDNEKKISILYENMTSMRPDEQFEDVIARPLSRKPMQRDAETSAEDEQLFLMKLQTQLTKQPAPGQRESPLRSTGSVQKPTTTSPRVGVSPATSAGMTPSPKKVEAGKPGAASSEGVLASFFNSLLSKKPGATPPPGTPGVRPPSGVAMAMGSQVAPVGAYACEHRPSGCGARGGAALDNMGEMKEDQCEEAAVPPSTPPPLGQQVSQVPDRASVSRDAAAELDRMNRAKKPTPLNNQTTPNSTS